jgi:glycerophosphoryl diester phosphodiesterase
VLAPDVSTVFLFEVAAPSVWRGRPPTGADLLGPGIKALRNRTEVVRLAHDQGAGVYVWTVNEPADIELMRELAVDGIITDRPGDVLAALGR